MENKILNLKENLINYSFENNIKAHDLLEDVKEIFKKEFNVTGITLSNKLNKIYIKTSVGNIAMDIVEKFNKKNGFLQIWFKELENGR